MANQYWAYGKPVPHTHTHGVSMGASKLIWCRPLYYRVCSKASANIEHEESVLALFLATSICNEYNLLTQFRAIFVCVLPFFFYLSTPQSNHFGCVRYLAQAVLNIQYIHCMCLSVHAALSGPQPSAQTHYRYAVLPARVTHPHFRNRLTRIGQS